MCIYVYEYMYICIHILDLPSLLLRSQTSIKLDCCWVEDQLFSTEADQRLASIRSSLCSLGFTLGAIFCHFLLVRGPSFKWHRFRLTTGLFSLWSGTPAQSHFCRAGARLRLQQWALCSGTVQATLQSWAQTGGPFKLIKRDALLLMPAQENTAVAKTPAVLQLIYIHSKAAGVSSHAEIHLMLRCL